MAGIRAKWHAMSREEQIAETDPSVPQLAEMRANKQRTHKVRQAHVADVSQTLKGLMKEVCYQ